MNFFESAASHSEFQAATADNKEVPGHSLLLVNPFLGVQELR